MLLTSLRHLRQRLAPTRRPEDSRRPPKPARCRRPLLEELEDRTVPSQAVDLGGLRFEAASFTPSNGGQLASGGIVQLGFTPTGQKDKFHALLDIDLSTDGTNSGKLLIETVASRPTFQITKGELITLIQGAPPILIWRTPDGTTPVPFDILKLLGSNGLGLPTGTPFKVAGFAFTMNNLGLSNPGSGGTSQAEVLMQGTLAFTPLAGRTTLAAPKVDVNGGNYVIASSAGVTLTGATFTLDSQSKTFNAKDIRTTDAGITVTYSHTADTWTLGGNVTITTQPQGTGQDPALSSVGATLSATLREGKLVGLQFGLSGFFTVLGVKVQTDTGNPLTFVYDAKNDTYEIGGGLTVTIKDTNTIDVNLGFADGNPSDAGILIQDGTLTKFLATVQTDFTLFGAMISTNASGLTFYYDQTIEQFEMYGSLTITVPIGKDQTGNKKSTTITATMGGANNPGLIIKDGSLQQINMGVTGQFNVYGLAILANGLNCFWTDQGGQDAFELSGGITLQGAFQASASFGTQGNPGLRIVNGQFAMDDFTFTAENVSLGAFSVQDLTVAYRRDPGQGYTVNITLDLLFPGGWRVGGFLGLVDGRVNDISLHFGANGDPIPVGDTGLFLNYMSATVENLASPANLLVSGSVSFVYGKPVSLESHPGIEVAAYQGSFTADKDELLLSASAAFCAYQTGTRVDPFSYGEPIYSGLLGQGNASLTLDWGDHLYKASLNMSFLAGVFDVSAQFSFSGTADDYSLLISAQADVGVPTFVPVIGGDKLAGLNFVLDYKDHEGQVSGFLAAWAQVHVIWTIDAGFEYVFTPGDDHGFHLIGSKGVDAIEHEISQPTPQTYAYTYTYQVPQGATGALFRMDWPAGGPAPTFSVVTPSGQTIDQNSFSASNGLSLVPTRGSSNSENIDLVGSSSNEDMPLPAGEYKVVLTSTEAYSPGPTFNGSFVYPKPTAAVGPLVNNGTVVVPVSLKGTVDEALASKATVSLYVDSSNQGYHGRLISSFGNVPIQTDGQGNWTYNGQWDLTGLLPVPYYVYAVFNDGVNAPVSSAYSGAVVPQPPLSGTISDPEHDYRVLPGLTVYLDVNHNGAYTPGDPVTTTGKTGFYAFYETDTNGNSVLPVNTPVYVGVIVPPGYVAQSANPVRVTYHGTDNLSVGFRVAELASVSGTVFQDNNQDGRQDPGDPGIPGIPVYLKSSGGQKLVTVSGSDGSYQFIDVPTGTATVGLNLPSDYYRTSPPSGTYSQAVTGQYQLVTGDDFGVLPFGKVSGNVASISVPNGWRNPDSTPLGGWTVDLLSGSHVVATTRSAGDGSYVFDHVKVGQYTVALDVQAGYRQVAPFQSDMRFSSPGTLVPTGGPPNSLATGDFNGDGFTDFAVTVPGRAGGNLLVFYGNGKGSFTSVALQTSFADPAKVVAFLFDNSGRLDLAVASREGQVDVFVNNGGRDWTHLPAVWKLPAGSGTFDDLVAGNFSGTGAPGHDSPRDLAIAFSHPYTRENTVLQVAVLLSDPARDVIVNPTIFGSFGTGPVGLASGDVNGDGKGDLLINSPDGTGFDPTIAYGDGTGHFTFKGFVAGYPFILGPAALGDVTGNGLLDAVTNWGFGSSEHPLRLSTQGPLGHFQADAYNGVDPTGISPAVGLVITDLNGDLKPDLVVSLRSGAVDVFLNRGTSPYFNDGSRVALTLPAGAAPAAMAAADLTGDGLTDLLFADAGERGVRVLLNQSTNTATFGATVGPGQAATGFDFAVEATGAITGTVTDDANRNGLRDAGERGLAGVTVYLDLTGSGHYVAGTDPTTTTAAWGTYAFTGVPSRVYGVGVLVPAGRVVTGAGAYRRLTGSANQSWPGADFTLAWRLIRPIPDQTVIAGTTRRLTVGLTGAQGSRRLIYSLEPGAPAGARIDRATGVFSWATRPAQAPGTYAITVRVTDPSRPTFTETATFRVTLGAPFASARLLLGPCRYREG